MAERIVCADLRARIARALGLLALGLLLAAAPATGLRADDLALAQPTNVGDAKRAATAYRQSGAYERDLAIVTAEAGAWVERRAPLIRRPAVVFDIDETALGNWEVIVANDFGRILDGPCDMLPKGPCNWVAWDLMARSTVISETLAFYQLARRAGAAVFFVTGRDEPQRSATVKNLMDAGYTHFEGLYMTPPGVHFASAADFKAPTRRAIEAMGYSIIANIGDQPSDLAGGYAERTFLLPNPFYRIP